MKFTDLSQHLRELRYVRTRRALDAEMTVSEVWAGAEECPHNGVSKIFIFEAELPRPFDGMFVRLTQANCADIAAVYLHKHLDPHWKEFVLIKELMHCWSPSSTFVGTPEEAGALVSALNTRTGRYVASVASDMVAIQAAAEVILPHYMVERHFRDGHDAAQIAVSHGLHPDVAGLICQFDLLQKRKNGCL